MCNAVQYDSRTIAFSREGAALPVIRRGGEIALIPWGGRYGLERPSGLLREAPADRLETQSERSGEQERLHLGKLRLPEGACARLESVREGRWKRWNPVPVQIPAAQYCERSKGDRCDYWYRVPAGFVLQGLYVPEAIAGPGGRVYVVTVDLATALPLIEPAFPSPPPGEVHDRWPRLVRQPDAKPTLSDTLSAMPEVGFDADFERV